MMVHYVVGGHRIIETLWAGYAVIGYALSFGRTFKADLSEYALTIPEPTVLFVCIGLAWLFSATLAMIFFVFGAKPRTNVMHVSGYEVKEGKEAIREAKRITAIMGGKIDGRFHVAFNQDLIFSKKTLSQHVVIAGGTGAGKSVAMKRFIMQLTAKPVDGSISKSFIYDPKPEYAQILAWASIVSPYHRFSRYWDIGRDIQTPLQAALFAQCLIPDEKGSNNKFFTEAVRSVVIGVIVSLQNTRGTAWGWGELAILLNHDAQELLPILEKHYPKGMTTIANTESQTTSSVIATLGAYTRIIDDLAAAWGNEDIFDSKGRVIQNKDGTILKRKPFSIREWCKDDNKGPNHIVVQGGDDPNLTRAYISAMVNIATSIINSPSLPNNEEGRCIAFFLDELPSLGKIDFMGLVDKGRQKGVVVVAAYQDIAQLKDIYGDHIGNSLLSMVGTHIYCKMSQGDTRKTIAGSFSSRYVASVEHGGQGKVTEHGKAVVFEDVLSKDLGFRKGKEYGPEGWGINCLVTTGPSNPMLLKVPGTTYTEYKSRSFVPAFRTMGPRNPEFLERPSQVEMIVEEREAAIEFAHDAQAFHKDQQAIREGAKIVGLGPDDLEAFLDNLRPKWDNYDPVVKREQASKRGFRRGDELDKARL